MKENTKTPAAKMCIAQYDIDRLQKMLDDELVRRSKALNEPLESTLVSQGSSCTVFVPMEIWKTNHGTTLVSPVV